MANSAISQITYQFGDASVPPSCHRSFAITVTGDKAVIVVDSYGDILVDETYPIDAAQFDGLREAVERNRIMNCVLTDDEGCTGGTSERISYRDGEKELFSGTVYHCGASDTGNLCGDIAAFAGEIKSLVPDLERLLQ
jgi:hypothetical protein